MTIIIDITSSMLLPSLSTLGQSAHGLLTPVTKRTKQSTRKIQSIVDNATKPLLRNHLLRLTIFAIVSEFC